jgi:hypothetical protein
MISEKCFCLRIFGCLVRCKILVNGKYFPFDPKLEKNEKRRRKRRGKKWEEEGNSHLGRRESFSL